MVNSFAVEETYVWFLDWIVELQVYIVGEASLPF
jgi:hypothetical protein